LTEFFKAEPGEGSAFCFAVAADALLFYRYAPAGG
jgi:hypothetical protein